jgi:hypothetical protein
MHIKTLADLERIAATFDRTERFPPSAMRVPRGKSAGTQSVSLPSGYLDDIDDATPPEETDFSALDGG